MNKQTDLSRRQALKGRAAAAAGLGVAGMFGSQAAQAAPTTGRATMRRVGFQSEGQNMVGNLFLPSSYCQRQRVPVVVTLGTWTSVKEMMANIYARKLAENGVAALTFDYRFYGESGGTTRNFESPAAKAIDIRNAVRWLQTQPFANPEAIGGLAICASAGYMLQAITQGTPIKSYVGSASWLHNKAIAETIYGGATGVAQKIAAGQAAQRKFETSGVIDYVPAYSETDANAAMYGNPQPFDYYANPRRGAIPQWRNQLEVKSWQGWLEFDPIALAPQVNIPTMFFHSDNAATADGVRAFHAAAKGPKSLVWLPATGPFTHFDFYDNDATVSLVAQMAAAQFRNTLV
jgi:uncharacterized protein